MQGHHKTCYDKRVFTVNFRTQSKTSLNFDVSSNLAHWTVLGCSFKIRSCLLFLQSVSGNTVTVYVTSCNGCGSNTHYYTVYSYVSAI